MSDKIDEFFKAFYNVYSRHLSAIDSLVGKNDSFYIQNGLDLPRDYVEFNCSEFLSLSSIIADMGDAREQILYDFVSHKYFRGKWLGYIVFESPISVEGNVHQADHVVILINNYVFDFAHGINAEPLKKYLKKLSKENEHIKILEWSRFTDCDFLGTIFYKLQSAVSLTEDDLKELR